MGTSIISLSMPLTRHWRRKRSPVRRRRRNKQRERRKKKKRRRRKLRFVEQGFLFQNACKRHSIARPWGLDIECLLWVQWIMNLSWLLIPWLIPAPRHHLSRGRIPTLKTLENANTFVCFLQRLIHICSFSLSEWLRGWICGRRGVWREWWWYWGNLNMDTSLKLVMCGLVMLGIWQHGSWTQTISPCGQLLYTLYHCSCKTSSRSFESHSYMYWTRQLWQHMKNIIGPWKIWLKS